MSECKKLGLRIVLWVATVLLDCELTAQQEEDLEHFRTTLNVTDFE